MLVEIQKVFTPNFDKSLTILYTVARVNSVNLWRKVIPEIFAFFAITKVSDQRNLKGDDLGFIVGGTRFTL